MSEEELKKKLEELNKIRYTLPQEVKDKITFKWGTYGLLSNETVDALAKMYPQYEVRKILDAERLALVIEDDLYKIKVSRKKREKIESIELLQDMINKSCVENEKEKLAKIIEILEERNNITGTAIGYKVLQCNTTSYF